MANQITEIQTNLVLNILEDESQLKNVNLENYANELFLIEDDSTPIVYCTSLPSAPYDKYKNKIILHESNNKYTLYKCKLQSNNAYSLIKITPNNVGLKYTQVSNPHTVFNNT